MALQKVQMRGKLPDQMRRLLVAVGAGQTRVLKQSGMDGQWRKRRAALVTARRWKVYSASCPCKQLFAGDRWVFRVINRASNAATGTGLPNRYPWY